MSENMDPQRYHPFTWSQLDVDGLQSDEFLAIVRHWEESRESRDAPVWMSSVLENLSSHLLRFANVIDVNGNEPTFSYRFFGSGLADMHTFELTHKTTDAIEPPGFRNLCVDQHLLTRDARRPLVFLNEVPTKMEGLFRWHLMLRLPYANAEGVVSNIMTIEQSETHPRDTWEFFRSN